MIGLTIDDVYIANILKYRPPNNRNPTPDEIARHTPYLVEQIKAIKPVVIATLGNFSTKFVLAGFDTDKMKSIGGITFLHGKPVPMQVDGLTFTVVPLYHPAAILYNPTLRQDLEKDFQIIKGCLPQQTGDSSSHSPVKQASDVAQPSAVKQAKGLGKWM